MCEYMDSWNINMAFPSHNDILEVLQMIGSSLTLHPCDHKAPRHKTTENGFKDLKVNFVCHIQKFKHKVSISLNNYCRWFAYYLLAPKLLSAICSVMLELGFCELCFPGSFDICLLLGSLMEAQAGDWKADGKGSSVFSPSFGKPLLRLAGPFGTPSTRPPAQGTGTSCGVGWRPILSSPFWWPLFSFAPPGLGVVAAPSGYWYEGNFSISFLLFQTSNSCINKSPCDIPLGLKYLFRLLFSWLELRYRLL